jgi:hypothetical protein
MDKVGANEHEITIFFDDTKIIAQEDPTSRWNQHMSSDGTFTDESKNIPYWLNYGHSGLYRQQPLLFLEATLNEIDSTKPHLNVIKKRLKEKGFVIMK